MTQATRRVGIVRIISCRFNLSIHSRNARHNLPLFVNSADSDADLIWFQESLEPVDVKIYCTGCTTRASPDHCDMLKQSLLLMCSFPLFIHILPESGA